MSEEQIIRHCAPTLARIKTGSLFSCPCKDRAQLLSTIRQLNRKLVSKGLRLIPLRFSPTTALLYLYRPSQLRADLRTSAATELLAGCGYRCDRCEHCIVQLTQRLRHQEGFPHEIGLFLGYPPEDVRGFMEDGPCAAKCTGCWKVYGDEIAAQKRFDQYKKCTQIYRDRWSKGCPIDKLAVPDRKTAP